MSRSALEELAAKCPVVVVGRAGTSRAPGVRASDHQGLGVAVDHLVRLGHERIAFVDGPPGSIASARRRGYREAMRRHGLGDRVDVTPGAHTEEAGAAVAAALLARPVQARSTAVACFNDRCAIGLRDNLLRGGVGVPAAVSVVGYDDSPLARLGTVELTSVSQDPAGLAEATMAVVVDLLHGEGRTRPAGDVVIPAVWSCGPRPRRLVSPPSLKICKDKLLTLLCPSTRM